MKIKLYGTGKMDAKSFSACALIDDHMLFDCPNGLMNKIKNDGVDRENISTIIISHFHADHDFDIPFVLLLRQNPITIIAPKGAKTRYKKMCKFANFIVPVPTFIVARDKTPIEYNGYKITPHFVEHCNMDAYSYTIEKDGKTVGFGGDSIVCDGLREMLCQSQIAFIDVTGEKPKDRPPMHMDIGDYLELKKQFPKCEIVPTHMTDETRAELKSKKLNPPEDNKEYEI